MSRQLSCVMRGTRIFIRDAEPAYDKPEWIVRLYCTRWTKHDLVSLVPTIPDDKVEDIKVFAQRYGHGYDIKWPGVGYSMEHRLSGDSRADFVEIEPFPCPKVRAGIETRYRDGQWFKLLKTGWQVIA